MAKMPDIWDYITDIDNITYITLRKHSQNMFYRRSRALMAFLLSKNFILLSHYSFLPLHFLIPSGPSDWLQICLILARPALTPQDWHFIAVFKLNKNNVPLPSPVFLTVMFFILKMDVTKNCNLLLSQNEFIF